MNDLINTIGKLLKDRSHKSPNLNAIGQIEGETILHQTFNDYFSHIKKLSIALYLLGFKRGDKMVIFAPTSKEWHYLDLATLCIGGIVVPIYHTSMQENIRFILEHSESKFIVIEDESFYKKVKPILNEESIVLSLKRFEVQEKENNKIIFYDDLISKTQTASDEDSDYFENTLREQSEEDIATIIYTSGTTGTPKGAIITHRAFIQMLKNIYKFSHNAINEKDSSYCVLPLSHVFGRCNSYLPILFGLENIFSNSIEHFIKNADIAKPTIILAVPRMFEKIYIKILNDVEKEGIAKKELFHWALKISNNYYNALDQDLTPNVSLILQYNLASKIILNKTRKIFGGKMRYFISGGAPLSLDILKLFRNSGMTILEGYGLTETVAPCTLNPFTKQIMGTVGRPIGDVEISFDLDSEILIKSKALFSGYYKEEELTKESFEGNWFRTGDLGKFTEDGYLKITGRKKDVIITSLGKNIFPTKIENSLKESPFISEVLIIGNNRKFLTALIALDFQYVQKFCEDQDISISGGIKAISSKNEINEIIKKVIETCNAKLENFETIKNFKILPFELSTDNYLTPSLKLRKSKLEEDSKDLIDAMYS